MLRATVAGVIVSVLVTIGAASPREASAQGSGTRYTAAFALPGELAREFDPKSRTSGSWPVETTGTMLPRTEGFSPDGVGCVRVGFEQDDYVFRLDGDGTFVGGVASSVDCGGRWVQGQPLAFRVFAAVSDDRRERIGAVGEFRVGWSSDPPPGRDIQLEELDWALQARTAGGWRTVATAGPTGTSAGSGWVEDPERIGVPALVLADAAATVVTVASAPVEPAAPARRRASAATLPAESLEFAISAHSDPTGLYVAGVPDGVTPVVDWQAGESIDRLRLRVLEGLSEPERGRYCAQAVYDDAGRARRLGRASNGHFSTSAGAAVGGEPSACRPDAELVFPIHVAGGIFRMQRGRFLIGTRADGAGTSFALADALVALNADGSKAASNGDAAGGGWFVEDAGGPALLLRGDDAKVAAAFQYTALHADAGDELFANGAPWPDGERRDATPAPLALGWNTPPSRVLLCSDSPCEEPFATLAASANGIEIDPRAIVVDFARPTVTVGVDWREGPLASAPGGSVASAPEPSAADAAPGGTAPAGQLVFAPHVTHGGWSRPLTSCLGRLVGAGYEGEPFALRRGLQVLDVATLPATLAGDAPVRVSFDRGRDGEECAVRGLQTPEMTLDELRARVTDGEIALEVPLDETLFVGYLQLNAALYGSSLARWKNALEFFDRLYADGHEQGRWADGVLFGAGERGGVVPRIDPAANFVASLGDTALIREVARAQRDNDRVASQFFDEQIDALADVFGEQPIELVYYDDLAIDCADYADDLARSPLATSRAVVVAGIDGYTANSGALRPLPGNLAYVCVESERLTVYAFNWRERADNEDFMQMLTTVLEDIERGGESVQ